MKKNCNFDDDSHLSFSCRLITLCTYIDTNINIYIYIYIYHCKKYAVACLDYFNLSRIVYLNCSSSTREFIKVMAFDVNGYGYMFLVP